MKLKKFLIPGLVVIASTATLISCGVASPSQSSSESEVKLPPITDYSGIQATVDQRKDEISNASKGDHFKMNVAVVTADGVVTDKTFNQSSWEAAQQIARIGGFKAVPVNSPSANLNETYNNLINSDNNIWILSGFQHGGKFQEWLKNDQNKQNFTKKGIIVIGIDWNLPDGVVPNGQFISVNYNVEESAWIMGYAAADFLSKKFPNDPTKRTATTFGGGTFNAVTDFIAGYLAGIKAFNDKNPGEETKITSSSISLDTGFGVDAGSTQKIKSILNNGNPTITFPVAGPQTGVVSDEIKTDADRYVIGVDTNQSLVFEKQKTKFFSSVEKRIGFSVFNILADIFTKKQTYLNDFQFKTKNTTVKLGYYKEFVGLSATTLEGDDKTKANEAIQEASAEFKKLVLPTDPSPRTTLKIVDTSDQSKIQAELDSLVAKINNKTA